MTQFTTLKEYDNAVRASQRKLKALNERLEANPLDGAAQQQKELAQAGHKFLLASRAKFKETGVSAPQLRDVQALALEEGSKLAQGVDPGTEPPVIFEGFDNHHGITRVRKPTAAEPQAPTPIDRAREFVPQARIIRERSHAGAMREPKYAADDCRSAGLGYKRVHRKGEAWRRTVALAVAPKFPSERYPTQRAMPNHSKRRITVNGQAWA